MDGTNLADGGNVSGAATSQLNIANETARERRELFRVGFQRLRPGHQFRCHPGRPAADP